MAYPKNYTAFHIPKELKEELDNLSDFGNIPNVDKLRQLLRFYKTKNNLQIKNLEEKRSF